MTVTKHSSRVNIEKQDFLGTFKLQFYSESTVIYFIEHWIGCAFEHGVSCRGVIYWMTTLLLNVLVKKVHCFMHLQTHMQYTEL